MRIGGSRGADPAAATVRQRALRNTRKPIFGIAMITPLVFAGAVSATGPSLPVRTPPVHAAVTPVAAVSPTFPDLAGPAVVAIDRGPTAFHVAEPALSAPPPAAIVNAPGALGIPSIALAAYRNAEQKMAVAAPGCGVSWNLLAGIGRIESGHAGGGAVDARGTAITPIYGPSLDGTLPGNEVIIQSAAGNRVTYARAMGPMQFLPGTWARYASDGKGDGVADPQNLFDSTLAAARYLCSGGLNLRDQSQVLTAILRYNNSMPYAQNVLGWAAAYATGVVPVDLPPMTGPPPPLGDAHLEHPEGLGPNLPMNINGLPLDDPLARVPLIDLSSPALGSPQPMFPWMTPTPQQAPTQVPGCTVICISSQGSPPPPPAPVRRPAAVRAPPPPSGPPPFAPPPSGPPPFGPPPPDAGPVPAPPAGVAPQAAPSPPAGPAPQAPSPAAAGPAPNAPKKPGPV
ncbi:lytic murein transglycosylase [Mycobacterium avium subsp. paratuberculosis]|nr:lytic murein transglycosylase [Mycobacterium avium subsp. paratuberculosis]